MIRLLACCIALFAFGSATATTATTTMHFGMYNNCAVSGSDTDTAAHWKGIRAKYMPSTVRWRREFNPGLPAAYNGGDVPYGISSFLSFKSSYLDVQSGSSKAAIQAYAKTWPQGAYATWQNEPESPKKEFAADPYHRFVLPFEKVYSWVKAVRPDVHFGPVHMAYQWGPGGTATSDASKWVVPASHADFYGVDWYNFAYAPVTWNLATATDFQNWWKTFSPQPRNVYIVEFGIEGYTSNGGKSDAQTVSIINASRTWVANHPKVNGVNYWNGINSDAGTHDIQITPCVGDTTGRPQSLAAWNAWASS